MKQKLMWCFLALCFVSCIKQNNQATVANVAIPFTDTMGILSVLNKCAGSQCHSPGGKEAEEFLYDPADYERSIKKNIEIIYKEASVYGKGMASAKYANLSQADITILKNWYAAGYPNGTPSSSKVLFSNTAVKPIFDKCASCHAVGAPYADKWTYNSSDYNTSIKANITRIYATVNSINASMSVKANLSQAEVNAIATWYQAGYSAN